MQLRTPRGNGHRAGNEGTEGGLGGKRIGGGKGKDRVMSVGWHRGSQQASRLAVGSLVLTVRKSLVTSGSSFTAEVGDWAGTPHNSKRRQNGR